MAYDLSVEYRKFFKEKSFNPLTKEKVCGIIKILKNLTKLDVLQETALHTRDESL